MKYALVDKNNIVVNVIVYNGHDPYVPPAGLSLMLVNEWLDIGNDINLPLPAAPVLDDETMKKARDDSAMNDLAIVAAYNMALEKSPDLNFSDYLDMLEVQAGDLKKNSPIKNTAG